MTSNGQATGPGDTEPADADALGSARRWSTAALIASGFSGLLVPLLGCLLLITMGAALFLFPVLIPGFVVGFLCAMRARRIEAAVGAYTTHTKNAYVLNAIGLSASLVLSLIAVCVAGIAYFGR